MFVVLASDYLEVYNVTGASSNALMKKRAVIEKYCNWQSDSYFVR